MKAAHTACPCSQIHDPRLVVLTGGPGGGKTAVLEMVRRAFCDHIVVLPEAASIVFGGGFPRSEEAPLKSASQRAIFHLQRELERGHLELRRSAVILCDRGTIDGLAYWPGAPGVFFEEVGTTLARELARYAAVIHLRTPEEGYDHRNPLRIETVVKARAIDSAIAEAWSNHPHRVFVDSASDFLTKVSNALERIREEVPACCHAHRLEGAGDRSSCRSSS